MTGAVELVVGILLGGGVAVMSLWPTQRGTTALRDRDFSIGAERGAEAERANVVSWLRHQAYVTPEDGEVGILGSLAASIERGEHRG